MKNPWLDIPLADYEGHMALPHVAQARLLSDIFADVLGEYSPRSVAILGCAGGNGFERISPRITERVVGVDINPEYLQQVRDRFHHRLTRLELFVGDIQTDRLTVSPVELVYAGLLFEYVDTDAVLDKIRSMLHPNGVLVTVVQMPSDAIPEITPSPFTSLHALEPLMRLVPPDVLKQLATARGYRETASRTVPSAGGKRFHVQTFRL